ncbi:metallophosphoesterase [Prolixibacteraceae bacterium Z1-6]|uniref:Metallophosphoesterase n=1 Tax=Draconibacterium aestuarii TaxID=2998507 RepID=A0A9X3F939_9BACT|nr:metallophosphoesterase [Prolixibacteraceae bacterium Z1-6]
MKRRRFIKNIAFVSTAFAVNGCAYDPSRVLDVTFFVAADTHFDPPPDSDTYYHIRAMNRIPNEVIWPQNIDGKLTEFGSVGKKVDTPKGIVLAGDILDKADAGALELFRQRYEQGPGDKQINYPVYIGLGNHDINPVIDESEKQKGRRRMWNYLEERHNGESAPVPVTNFDAASRNYSWDWDGLHLVQTHLFAGATSEDQPNSLKWLKDDLTNYASDGSPVVIIQHYGFDSWALNWWTAKERSELFAILKKYNVVAVIAGHSHYADNLEWEGIPVFQVNNAWPEIGNGNNDGNGSFAMFRITNDFIDMATCRWKNGNGEVDIVEPFYSKKYNK